MYLHLHLNKSSVRKEEPTLPTPVKFRVANKTGPLPETDQPKCYEISSESSVAHLAQLE
jgi:hypothetical protein